MPLYAMAVAFRALLLALACSMGMSQVSITRVRLVGGGPCTTRGRVEFLVGGTQWQAACGGNFGQTEADVVCRQLGHGPALMWYTDSKFQPSKHIVHEPIACMGTESTIGECSLAPHIPATCDNDNEAGVFCSEPEGESVNITGVRLMDGQSSRDGRVEFRVGSEWQSVCDTTFGPDEAEAVCRHSGLGRAVAVYKGSLFGANTAITHPPICCIETGDVNDCVIPSDVSRTCGSDEAAGVVCSGAETPSAQTVQGSARLVDGTTLYGGRLEVLHQNKWMTVEVNSFKARRIASLACPSMGFENYNRTPSSYISPSPEEDAWCILDVECSDGSQMEEHLGDCFFPTVSKVCKREEDIGIYCNTIREEVPAVASVFSLGYGTIAGIVLGVLVVVILVLYCTIVCCCCCYVWFLRRTASRKRRGDVRFISKDPYHDEAVLM